MHLYWGLRDEKLVSSLSEFRHLTFAQIRLFAKAVKDEHERSALEKRLNKDIKARQGSPGGQIRVVG